jgi:hypothetical protein
VPPLLAGVVLYEHQQHRVSGSLVFGDRYRCSHSVIPSATLSLGLSSQKKVLKSLSVPEDRSLVYSASSIFWKWPNVPKRAGARLRFQTTNANALAAVTWRASRGSRVSTALWPVAPDGVWHRHSPLGCRFRALLGVCGYRRSPPRILPCAPGLAATPCGGQARQLQSRPRSARVGLVGIPYTMAAKHGAAGATRRPPGPSNADHENLAPAVIPWRGDCRHEGYIGGHKSPFRSTQIMGRGLACHLAGLTQRWGAILPV